MIVHLFDAINVGSTKTEWKTVIHKVPKNAGNICELP